MADQSQFGRRSGKSPSAFRTISEVATELELPQHVLRFWESKFSQIKPMKRGGGRRYYRPEDLELLRTIRTYLYEDGYTIKGVQKLLKEGALSGKPAQKTEATVVPSSATATNDHSKLNQMRGVLKELEEIRGML